jgi:hypothetical protein
MTENFSYIPVFKRINPYDYNINTFKTYKRWIVNEFNYSSSYNKMNIYQGLIPEDIYRNSLIPISSSKYTINPNLNSPYTDKSVMWYSLEHNYYKDYNKLYNIYDKKLILNFYDSASLFNVPRLVFGEEIKRGSVEITDYSSLTPINLVDDRKGNLIDININTSSFVKLNNLKMYVGFNESYDKRHTKIKDHSEYNNSININGNVLFDNGIETTGIDTISSGKSFLFNSSNYITIKNNNDWLNINKNDNFSISFWIKTPLNQINLNSQYNTIISKKREGLVLVQNKVDKKQNFEYKDINENIYPINISIYNTSSLNNGKLLIERSDGVNYFNLTSSIEINDNQFHHIVLTKSSSFIKLYIDNILDTQLNDNINFNINNICDWFIGSEGVNRNTLSGSIDEIRLYDTFLNDNDVYNLYNNDFETGTAYQTNRVGNVFYKSGAIIITDFRKRYNNIFLGNNGNQNYLTTLLLNTGSYSGSGFKLQFKSTQTIYEHEIICKIKPSEFNMSLNPTLRINNNINSEIPKSFVTASYFDPFITTIGLYNDNYELVAIGKLASPIPKIEEAPVNIIVKFDT